MIKKYDVIHDTLNEICDKNFKRTNLLKKKSQNQKILVKKLREKLSANGFLHPTANEKLNDQIFSIIHRMSGYTGNLPVKV